MLLVVLVCSLTLCAEGQRGDDAGVDARDILDFDASTQTTKKSAEPAYDYVATKIKEHNQDSSQGALALCSSQVLDLQKTIEEQKNKIVILSGQLTCNPGLKRYLRRLLKEMQRVGLPSDSLDVIYDAKVRLSKQVVTEIMTLLEDEDNWRTGALDNALDQILVDLKPHDYEAWKWRFEDTFGVELDTLLKMAFVETKNNMVKINNDYEKCTGVSDMEWINGLREWYRSTWTVQDDPCKRYYDVLIINPFLRVPPTKAITVTVTMVITEPLKEIGQGIGEFFRVLPVTLQIAVFLAVVFSIWGEAESLREPATLPERGPGSFLSVY